MNKLGSMAENGVPTPTATPPPVSENKKFNPAAVLTTPAFKADVAEAGSPKSLATEPASQPPKEEELPTPAVPATQQVSGPVIVRLPPFTISRTIAGSGRRQLTIGLAVAFADAAQAKAIEAQAPLMQDAVLGSMRGVDPSMFVDPDQAELKRRLTDAIRAKIPAFPADGLLVPQLEAGLADAAPDR